jgi:TolB-like protein/DNA-binding winged helix-turn-helix (wHTH) protein
MTVIASERPAGVEAASPSLLRFGAFEIDLTRGELRKNGARIKLQDKPFQILVHLTERAGEVVTREELRQRVWPADTFVDFDANLNTGLNKLRQALGDSAESPVFIQTMPRRGYCFIAPVTAGEPTPAISAAARSTDRRVHGENVAAAMLPAAGRTYQRRAPLAVGSVVLLALVGFALYSVRPALTSSAKPAGRVLLLVLPFQDLSVEQDQKYFAGGLTEELTSQLAQFRPSQLGVIARTTAAQYKETRKTVDQISRELRVDYMLEGSVRRANGRERISVRFIRTRDQTPLWAKDYETDIFDTLVVQHEVATMVVQELPLTDAIGSLPTSH